VGALLLVALPARAKEQVYRVAHVINGDTIVTLEHGKVRFAITAAPETAGRARCPREAAIAEQAKNYVTRRIEPAPQPVPERIHLCLRQRLEPPLRVQEVVLRVLERRQRLP
jgi:endonuclease YncB( thermonuclease family)